MTVAIDGRTYEITRIKKDHPHLFADMIARGWDGYTYMGESKPTGRQRRSYAAMFHRSAKTGEFVLVFKI